MRIAHLSDLHLKHHLPGSSDIPKRQSRLVPNLLNRAMVRLQSVRPDLLVVSGDLLDYPLGERGDPRFRSLGLADLRMIGKQLGRVTCPTIVMPGNHDVDGLCGRIFCQVREKSVAGHRVVAFYDEEGESYVPHRRGAERRRFNRVLSDEDERPQVHIQHYVVWPEINDDYPYSYAEANEIKSAILTSGRVRLCLSGHYHSGVAPFQLDGTWFAVAPAFCEAPFPFWVYDLKEDDVEWHEERLDV